MESFLGKLPEEKIIKAKELIESFKDFNETMPVLLGVLDNAMGDPDLSGQLISFLIENIDEDSDVDELLDELENFLFELAIRPFVEKQYLTEEKSDELFKQANKWILYSKISRTVKVLEEGLITRKEFDELLENRNPNLEYIDYLGTLIHLYLNTYITSGQFTEIKQMSSEEREVRLRDLAAEVETNEYLKFQFNEKVKKGILTQAQADEILLISDTDKKNKLYLLISVGDDETKLDNILKYLYKKKDQNVSEIDMIDGVSDKLKRAIEMVIDFETKDNID